MKDIFIGIDSDKSKIEVAINVIILVDTHNRKPSDADRSVPAALTVEKVRPEVDTVVDTISADTVYLENAKVDTIIQSEP